MNLPVAEWAAPEAPGPAATAPASAAVRWRGPRGWTLFAGRWGRHGPGLVGLAGKRRAPVHPRVRFLESFQGICPRRWPKEQVRLPVNPAWILRGPSAN